MKKILIIVLIATLVLCVACETEKKTVKNDKEPVDVKPADRYNRPGPSAPPPEPRVVEAPSGELQTYEDVTPREQQECSVDNDCVPIPTCHPRTCINKEYTGFYKAPDACTEMFDCSAAYNAEDCSCVGTKCTNMNLGDKGCPDRPSLN